ncbi:uncharacterized protein LOC135961245 [Calliphora vicina]|uniref:uncharacterized protein LOC135961245 n=1 Tax=Calliphora vicina TaxID=7373 RepID=UPI00325C1E41
MKNNGLHWCCESCRKLGVNYYRFFQDTKKKFMELQDDANKLNDRISEYGNLFDDYKSLDNLKSPPQSSPKRRKSAKEKRDEQPSTSVSGPPSNSDPSVPSNSDPSVPTDCNFPSSNAPKLNCNNLQLSYADAILNTANINNNTSYNPPQLLNNENVRIPLRAIPPKKTIFISRLANDTTTESVDYYVKNIIGNEADISIQKFNFPQPRSISSFKITVSIDIFKTLDDPNFWPINTLVREYIYRPRPQNIAVLPQREFVAPKN